MEIEHIEFREAASILAKEAGIQMQTQSYNRDFSAWKDIFLLYRHAAEWYHKNLFAEDGSQARAYLSSRWLGEEIIEKFNIGYSSEPRALMQFLVSQWFDKKFIIDSGLFVSESRDKFFGRIIFPISNAMGNPVAFTGRILGPWEPKYLNSPASKIFDKSSILYWLHLAKQEISKQWFAIIVEWQMDTVTLHQAWIHNAVGISWTALTTEHIRILKRFSKWVYLSLDSDTAGVKATFLSIENLMNSDLEIRVIVIPEWKDPDEFIRSGWDFMGLIDSSLSAIDFYIKHWKLEFDMDTIIWQKQLIEKCIELVVKIESPIEVDFYMKKLSEIFGISRDALYETLKKIKHKKPKNTNFWSWNWNTAISNELTPFSPQTPSLIAAYIHKTGSKDLFFSQFAYTIDDLEYISHSWLLKKILTDTPLDESDKEALSTYELYIDETLTEPHPHIIQRHILDLIKTLHSSLLEHEKNSKLSSVSSDSEEYLQIYMEIMKKAHKLGISPGILS